MIFNPWRIIGGLVLAIAVALIGVQTGKRLERTTWQTKAIATAAANQKALNGAIQAAQREQLSNEAKARLATENHAKSLSALDQKYAAAIGASRNSGGLRIAKSVCNPVAASNQSPGPSRPDEAGAGDGELSTAVTDGLYALTKRADELAEQLRSLQGWIADNGFYGDGKQALIDVVK